MGYYINPPDMTKEQWLKENAAEVHESDARDRSAGDNLVVCLVDNGWMTAAGICYDDGERDAFMRPDSGDYQRPRKWYVVSRALLAPYLPERLRAA